MGYVQHPSHIKTEGEKSEQTVQHTQVFSTEKLDVGPGGEERVGQTSFATLSPSSSSSSPSVKPSTNIVVAEGDVRETRPSSQAHPGNMSQEAIDTEVVAFLAEN